jgi:hypothetical protein
MWKVQTQTNLRPPFSYTPPSHTPHPVKHATNLTQIIIIQHILSTFPSNDVNAMGKFYILRERKSLILTLKKSINTVPALRGNFRIEL